MPFFFYHLSSFLRAQHNFWGAFGKENIFLKAPDVIFLHYPVPCFQFCRPSRCSAESISRAFRMNKNDIDMASRFELHHGPSMPDFICSAGTEEALTGRP